ncbi:Acetyltransferase [Mesotoga infera]|jgi:GNAT superfamily N-acetyltransferase|uniref:Acetyltransferase n=1 Tax=Mesotoga infera TaxID=1236046 RepID=A0A7Z7LGF6_9BACT|nr:GNAT family N-acetyltransferase [Mesotoga infera]SSC13485.1 Acetyltransferase [Mesotoga infera]
MEILPYSKDRQEEIMMVEKFYAEKYPFAESFDVLDLKNPLLNGRKNILLALQSGKVVGFSKFLSRQNFSSKFYHHIWLDIKTVPFNGAHEVMKKLFQSSIRPIRESTKSYFRAAGTRICVKLHESETERSRFFEELGFLPWIDFYYMERDLELPVMPVKLPESLLVKVWKPKKEPEILKYLSAEQSCFPDSPLEYRYLNYFFQRPDWKSQGAVIAVFDGKENLVASLMVYPSSNGVYYTEEVFVVNRWRGKGVARALMSEALIYLQNRQARSALLSVTSDRTTALKIYRECGYVHTFTRKVLVLPI